MRRRAASRRLAPTAGSLRAKHAAPLPFIVFDFHPESYRMKLRSFYKTLARLSSPFRVFSAQTPPRGQVFQKNFKKGLDTRRAIWYTLSRSNELAPIAQLDRAFDYESKGHRFESCWVHHRLLTCLAPSAVVFLCLIFLGIVGVLKSCSRAWASMMEVWVWDFLLCLRN